MKVYYSWKRNTPSTATGESLTVTITYQSFDKSEIDSLEEVMPKGVVIKQMGMVKANEQAEHSSPDY